MPMQSVIGDDSKSKLPKTGERELLTDLRIGFPVRSEASGARDFGTAQAARRTAASIPGSRGAAQAAVAPLALEQNLLRC
jgi:hypothetical protein